MPNAWFLSHSLHAAISETTRRSLPCLLQVNINGRVLSQCNLDELKKEMEMNFGDWQLFRAMVRQHFSSLLPSLPGLTFLAFYVRYINSKTE